MIYRTKHGNILKIYTLSVFNEFPINWTRTRTGLLLKKWHTNNKMQYIIDNGEKITDDNLE